MEGRRGNSADGTGKEAGSIKEIAFVGGLTSSGGERVARHNLLERGRKKAILISH